MDTIYRVLIVDDEEASLIYLRSIIDNYCPGFCVLREAHDGADALMMLGEEEPDVLITDVRMPGMDGVALAKEARRMYPDITILMISGYSDFEYARGAVSAGAAEYLLKPLNVMQIARIMEDIRCRLDARYALLRTSFLRNAVFGGEIDRNEAVRLFSVKRFHAAVLRRGNLSSRLRLPDLGEADPLAKLCNRDMWLLRGRDLREYICIMPYDADLYKCLDMLAACSNGSGDKLCVTIVFGRNYTLSGLRNSVLELTSILDKNLVIGLKQAIDSEKNLTEKRVALSESSMQKIQHCLSVSDYAHLKEQLFQWAIEWDQTALPQSAMEDAVDRISIMAMGVLPVHKGKRQQVNMEIAEVMQVAGSMSEAMSGIWDILFESSARDTHKERRRQGYGELLSEIVAYVREHYAEAVCVQSVCAVFGISPTYLSRLFRHESDTTFSELLTECRIEQAKVLMLDHENTRLRDIAQCVGYEDPSYFIKVFKKQTGLTPSQFMENHGR